MYKIEVCDNFLDIKDEKNNVVFTMKEALSADSLIVGIAGSVQTDAVYEFEDEIMAALSVCKNAVCCNPTCNRISFNNLIFDLSRVTYISSAALKAFLKIQGVVDSCDMHMSVINPSEQVMQRLEETGYVDILEIKVEETDTEE